MFEKKVYKLKINENFKNLIPPLIPIELETLEENIIREGCREPICVWNNYIIDGHNRYSICQKHSIPFFIQEVFDLNSEIDVINWICSNQLGRRNISDETRKYLIGKKYETEKIKSLKNKNGENQYTKKKRKFSKDKTATKIAKEYNISKNSVHRYAKFSKALDRIYQKEPLLASKIFSGMIRFSQKDIEEISNKNKMAISNINEKLGTNSSVKICKLKSNTSKSELKPQIKNNILEYDPNSDVISLTITITYRIDSIERIINKSDLYLISKETKMNLQKELLSLEEKTMIIKKIMENING